MYETEKQLNWILYHFVQLRKYGLDVLGASQLTSAGKQAPHFLPVEVFNGSPAHGVLWQSCLVIITV